MTFNKRTELTGSQNTCMNMKLYYIVFLYSVVFHQFAYGNSYPEVIFDNSAIEGSYAKSAVVYSGASWVENVNNHLLVSDSVFFTPGNALSLRYISSLQGSWDVDLLYSRQKFSYPISAGDMLSLKLYVESEATLVQHLPRLSINQNGTSSLSIDVGRFIEDYQTDTWLEIKIPIAQFRGIDVNQPISGVTFSQNVAAPDIHHLFIDQVEFLPAQYPQVRLSSPAVLSSADAYGHHVHLQWQLPLTPSIRYIKIYRSEDNVHFEPVGIRTVHMQSALDYVPFLDKTYYYKIAWVDFDYKESPFSTVLEVLPEEISDEQLLNLVQVAHINYFVENYDINTGLHLPFRMKDQAIVSTRETGFALLSMLIGVERGFVSRNIFVNRVRRIVDFLEDAPNKYGILASFYDGRSRLPEYMGKRPNYSVESTTAIIEALLVVRQYLSADNDAEQAVREKITSLWENIEWPALLLTGSTDVLRSEFNLVDELNDVRPLGGFNESMSTYLLAAASTRNSIASSGFLTGITSIYDDPNTLIDSLPTDSVESMQVWNEIVEEDAEQLEQTLHRRSAVQDTVLYGVRVPFGDAQSTTLLRMYRPFLTLNPRVANTDQYRFMEVLDNYTKLFKRRDNEIGLGTTNPNVWGYNLESDSTGRINPATSISSIFLETEKGMAAIKTLYHQFGHILFTEYGFRAWVDLTKYDVSDEYLSENQSAVAVMIENARTGLIWKLYDDIPEIKTVKGKLFVGNTLR